MRNSVVLILLTVLSSFSMAHEGHDHSSPEAGIIHLLWILPFIIAAGISYSLFKTKQDNEE